MSRLFQYRFDEGTGLEGHSFGNLFIVAMSEVTGNFERPSTKPAASSTCAASSCPPRSKTSP